MLSRVRLGVFVCVSAGLVVAAGFASAARADILAQWNFAPGASFLADSSANHHDLADYGNTASSTDAPTGSGLSGSASFSGAQGLYAGIDLSGYSHIRVSWWQKVKTNDASVLFEYGYDAGRYGGGFTAAVNSLTTGTGTAALCTEDSGNGYAYDGYSHAAGITDGVVNDTWERISVDYDIGTSIASNKVVASNGGVPGWDIATTTTTGAFGSGEPTDTPSTFHIGARWGGTEHYFYTGEIAGLTIESVPEPGTIVLLATGMIGLLAFAWQKRR